MTSPRILISACLLGSPVRYDGRSKALEDRGAETLLRWQARGWLVPICPEVGGGLPVPRPAAEILGGTGEAVLDGRARLVTADGTDVTSAFLAGARAALSMAQEHQVRCAILKARSPSCGSHELYDGSFSRTLRSGAGVTAALLQRHGIAVFSEEQLAAAEAFIAAG